MAKKYSLALGGGAARGLVHIGVLKYLEENNIQVNEVSGTSMGAIVAALFASGKTSIEIEEFAKSINYLKLADWSIASGLLKGNRIYKKLQEVFGDTKIEKLPIKLKIVATCLETGKNHIFSKGKIVDALRCSMSLPGIMEPYKNGKRHYIDGGVTNNLPVEALNGKNIIAVSALKKITGPLQTSKKLLGITMKRTPLNINYQVMHRTILMMMEQNEIKSLETKGKNITFIDPDFKNLDFYSFHKLDDFIKLGYREAKTVMTSP